MRALLFFPLALALAACSGDRTRPFGTTHAGGTVTDPQKGTTCSWYLDDGKDRVDTSVAGNVCGGKLNVHTADSNGSTAQKQALDHDLAIANGVRAAVADGLRVGLGIAAPLLAAKGVKLPKVEELVPEPEPTPAPTEDGGGEPAPGGIFTPSADVSRAREASSPVWQAGINADGHATLRQPLLITDDRAVFLQENGEPLATSRLAWDKWLARGEPLLELIATEGEL